MKHGLIARGLLALCATALTVQLGRAGDAHAAQTHMTGRDVLESCDSGDSGEVIALLAGGMANGLLMGQSLGGPGRKFCPPNDGRLTNGQYRKVTCDFLRTNPKLHVQDSFVAIGISLLNTYPCSPPAKK